MVESDPAFGQVSFSDCTFPGKSLYPSLTRYVHVILELIARVACQTCEIFSGRPG